jgi:hypothetical protein
MPMPVLHYLHETIQKPDLNDRLNFLGHDGWQAIGHEVAERDDKNRPVAYDFFFVRPDALTHEDHEHLLAHAQAQQKAAVEAAMAKMPEMAKEFQRLLGGPGGYQPHG